MNIHKLGESKTNLLLLVFAGIAFISCVVAAAFFGQALWNEFFDLLKWLLAGGTARGIANDGIPSVVRAYGESKVITPPEVLAADAPAAIANAEAQVLPTPTLPSLPPFKPPA